MAAALGPISIFPHQFLAFSAPSSALFSPISAPFSLISDYFINNVSRPSPVFERFGRGEVKGANTLNVKAQPQSVGCPPGAS